jgi:hypothetical protein
VCDRLGQRARHERADLTGPNPVDRGKKGSKIHIITDRTGLPISVAISAANTHDSKALEPLVRGTPPIRSRRGPRRRRPAKLHGDKGYDYPHLRVFLRGRGIVPRIARRGIESSQRLGRHSPITPPLRTPGRSLRFLRRSRSGSHLLPQTRQMSHALRPRSGFTS